MAYSTLHQNPFMYSIPSLPHAEYPCDGAGRYPAASASLSARYCVEIKSWGCWCDLNANFLPYFYECTWYISRLRRATTCLILHFPMTLSRTVYQACRMQDTRIMKYTTPCRLDMQGCTTVHRAALVYHAGMATDVVLCKWCHAQRLDRSPVLQS